MLAARERALRAALASLDSEQTPEADAVRQELVAHLRSEHANEDGSDRELATHDDIHDRAVRAAREAVLAMRQSDEIGDDAFHRLEEELDCGSR